MAEFVEMRPQRVHRLGPLLHELLARAERNGPRLLVGGLRFDETHGRPQRRLDNRLRVGRVILLALQERLDIVRRDQPDLVPEAGHFPRPMVRANAGFHRHETRR